MIFNSPMRRSKTCARGLMQDAVCSTDEDSPEVRYIMVVHHVKIIGESKYTDCGMRCINTGLAITQDGEVTCEDCRRRQDRSKDGN